MTYADCTAGNHVYYSRYLDILEAARGEMFRGLDAPFLSWQEQNTAFPVVQCQLRYKAPARYDDLLSIELWLSALHRVQFEFRYNITKTGDVLVLEASTLHACTSTLDDKLQRVPVQLAERLSPYLHEH